MGAPAGTQKPAMRLMLQKLLADRFGLVLHRDTRTVPGFELVVGKDGYKTGQAEGKCAGQRSDLVERRPNHWKLRNDGGPGRPADARHEPSHNDDRPAIFTALQNELGLKLNSVKVPIEVIVVDRVQKVAKEN